MKIAITGGGGFLGQTAIAEASSRGHEAWPFDRSLGHDVLGDLSGLDGADAVVHLAGVLGTDELFDRPEEAIDVNVKGTLRVLEWCRKSGAAYVGISMLPVFPSVYTATKVAAARLASAWHHTYGVPVTHVRAFNVHGRGQAHGPGHPQKILPTFATKAWRNEPLPIWGDGEQMIDLVRSADVARMLIDATRVGGGDVTLDAGTGVSVTVNQLANFVLETTGSTAGVEHLPMRRGEIPTNVVAEGLGWTLVGWEPEFWWEDVAETIEAYRCPT